MHSRVVNQLPVALPNGPLHVEIGDDAIIIGELFANLGFGARPGGELLVPAGEPTVVERMQWSKVRRERHLSLLVSVAILVDHDARIVWIAERQIGEKRPAR